VSRLEAEASVRGAMDHDRRSRSYRPGVLAEDGSLIGAGARLRWRQGASDGGGEAAPTAEFIAVAEGTGLIVPIGGWVVREACRHLAQWQAAAPGRAPQTVSVNLSGRQLGRPDLSDVVEEALSESGLQPSCLCLEITESVLMD